MPPHLQPCAQPRMSCVRVRAAATPQSLVGNHSCHNGAHLSKERKAELERVCEHIAQPGKGITACDEGPGTIGKRHCHGISIVGSIGNGLFQLWKARVSEKVVQGFACLSQMVLHHLYSSPCT